MAHFSIGYVFLVNLQFQLKAILVALVFAGTFILVLCFL